ncbi:hypothetical protein BKA67DRAFT_113482 [Truncatella angustata]|uniref:Uncharacterized protein n=1 Tax=Truncatella angustata TaxID=152316 RepID=A0A9P8UB37_9PEZI|nr:uncharacterized protein BKA67DRAFT_113482 [Truncatella angustata]KAH6645482.1 hypothetical protein BKA67DRAFT_113482 [Truncatella angustata]
MASVSEPTQIVETFSKSLRELANDKSFQHITNLINDKSRLEKDNVKLVSTKDGLVNTIADLHHKVTEAETAAKKSRSDLDSRKKEIQALAEEHDRMLKEIATLKKQLQQNETIVSDVQRKSKQKQDHITQLQQMLSQESTNFQNANSAQKKLQTHLEALQQDFRETKESLDTFTSLTSSVINMPKNDVANILEGILLSVCQFVLSYVNVELESGVLATIPVASTGRSSHSIPLLNSNSKQAKFMRVAASIYDIARSFEKHIFQSSYLLEHNGLCQILSDLASDDPDREAHIRAVLMPVQPKQDIIDKRIDRCVHDIIRLIDFMILPSSLHDFRIALRTLCTQTCESWTRLQRLQDRIKISFNVDDSDELNQLSTYFQIENRQARQTDGTSISSADSTRTAKKGSRMVEFENFGVIIWPSFIWDEDEIIQNCAVLSSDQIKRAREEQGIFRDKRLARRESDNVTAGKRSKKDGNFLSGDSAEQANGG